MTYHCPICGDTLVPVPEDNKNWFKFCKTYMDAHGTS